MNGAIITHHYWWDNGMYFRQSLNTHIVEVWTGLEWQVIEPAKIAG